MRAFRSFAAVAVLATLAACDLSTEPDVPDPIDPLDDTYATALGVDIGSMSKTQNGVYYKEVVTGTGDAMVRGDSVRVHYTGYLTNGVVFDTSKDGSAQPFQFRTGINFVIPGFEEGIIGMKPGGTRQIVVPTGLAYGPVSQRGIPPNSNLVFVIEYLAKL